MKSKSTFLKIIGAVALINIISRLIGFFRETIIGYQYGTSYYADSIVTAYFFPNFLYIVIGGSLTTAFISIYSKVSSQDKKKKVTQSVLTLLSIFLIVFLIIVAFFSKPIIQVLFGGMTTGELELTNKLFLFMLPSAFFLIISMFLSGLMNVHRKFRFPAYATLVNNLVFVLIALLFTGMFGVYSYAIGAVLAAVIMSAMLWWVLRKDELISAKVVFNYNSEVKSIVKLFWPIMLGGATVQLYFLIHRVFASYLSDGYVAALNYSAKLTQLPQVVLITAVTTVIYPLLAKRVAEKNFEEIHRLYQKGLWLLFLAIIPISIFIAIYSYDMVSFIFEYGQFTRRSTEMTAPLLTGLVLGMFFHSANVYITRFFYAYERSKTPVAISLICVGVINIVLSYLLMKMYGAIGIALGTTISAMVNFILLIIFAKFMLKLNLFETNMRKSIFNWAVLLIVWTALVYSLSMILTIDYSVIQVAIAFLISFTLFVVLLKFFRMPEYGMLVNQIKKRIVVK